MSLFLKGSQSRRSFTANRRGRVSMIVVLGILLAGLAVGLWIAYERHNRGKVEAVLSEAQAKVDEYEKLKDSTEQVMSESQAEMQYLDSLKETLALEAAVQKRRAKVLEVKLDSIRQKRDTIKIPEQSDSTSPRWKSLYEHANEESLLLREQVVAKNEEIHFKDKQIERAERTIELLRVDAQNTKVLLAAADGTVQDLNQKLKLSLKQKECKIVGNIPCLNRKVTGLIGFGLGLVIK